MFHLTKLPIASLLCALFLSYNSLNAQEKLEEKQENEQGNFTAVLEQHLQSITEKNIEYYLTDLSEENISMILPNGNLKAKFQEIKQLQKDWFDESGWKFEYKILRTSEGEKIAYALLDVDYYMLDEQNTRDYRPYFLMLVFEKENDDWKLSHGQSTPNISKKIAAESNPAAKTH